jgi:hypothetical protein
MTNEIALGDFISLTISEIVRGVVEAQKQVEEQKARINPEGIMWAESAKVFVYDRGAISITKVAFDIVLTKSENEGVKGGVGVFLGGIGLGTQANLGYKNDVMNRLQFELLIELPKQAQKTK